MTIELAGAILFFLLTVFALLFSITKSSQVDSESFPNRGRFYIGLSIWIVIGILAVFMSFPGYADWFIPVVYPVLKASFLTLFLVGFFMIMTTLVAFPQHMSYFRREIDGRSDRIALLENIRQIASQPYPITELFTLVLKELGSFLVIQKGAVFMINPSRREMYLVAQIGLNKDELARLERFPIGRDIISQAATDQNPLVSGDLAASDSASRKLLLAGREMTMSAAALPLSSRDKSLGALLVLSDKPYRFEKRDRMLLTAAAEAVAGVVEANRLSRDNQKLEAQLEDSNYRLTNLRGNLEEIAKTAEFQKSVKATCRNLVERYNAHLCRVVKIEDGELIDISLYETGPEASAATSESYRTAVVDAIRRNKTVVLNQEAKNQSGGTFIIRTALLSPFKLRIPGEYALLLEAPGNGLPLDNRFLSDIESVINLVSIALNISGIKEADSLNQTAVTALLHILKIEPEAPDREIFSGFLAEAGRLLGYDSTALAFVRDQKNQYCIVDDGNLGSPEISETAFLPGEGPVGRAAATGEMLEFSGRENVEKGWSGLDQVNQDFLNHLGGEKGHFDYQLSLPITVLNEVVAVIAVFSHTPAPGPSGREKSMIMLAAQLLAIRLSMARMDKRRVTDIAVETIPDAGHTINRINNDLATIMGQAELLERHPDISGHTRQTAGDILKAAELAAGAVRYLQDQIARPKETESGGKRGITERFNHILQQHQVTGNLYMFENNRTVTLHKDLIDSSTPTPDDLKIIPFLESVLKYFVALQDEGDEVLLKSRIRDGYFYLSLVRGSREKHAKFEPADHDFGSPDVLPSDIANTDMITALNENRGEVSFDRFGRRPTYLSFRFPSVDQSAVKAPAKAESPVAGLRILAIDDQQMILDLLAGICQSLGLDLTALRDPARGMELFRSHHFDIVMVDLAIGNVSGWDIARQIKSHAADTPVIMMTGWGMDIDDEKAAGGGVDFTLAKPFRIEQLTEAIMRAKTKLISS